MTQVLDLGVPTSRLVSSGVGLVGGGDLSADRTLTVAVSQINGFRLTLTTGVPVTTSDVVGATTIYLTPYKGNQIALNNGSGSGVANWQLYSSAEVNLALGTLTSGLPYDVFVYVNAGALTLELLAWTNGTTRATAITLTDGVYLKSGSLTRRYVGTFYTTSTTATEDSQTKRFLFNVDNRVRRTMSVTESTSNWNYTIATWRSANNSTSNRLQYIDGIGDVLFEAYVQGLAQNAIGIVDTPVGVGVDSTSVNSGLSMSPAIQVASAYGQLFSRYLGVPGLGFHYLQWLEYSTASGTTTWWGNGGVLRTSGISGLLVN